MNHSIKHLPLLLALFFIYLSTNLFAGIKPGSCRCEYLINPLGIDCKQPRFSWMMDDVRRGARQMAFQLEVGLDSGASTTAGEVIWNSGKVNGAGMLTVYQGPPLKPLTKYFWRLHIWDETGQSFELPVAGRFETGMMGAENWLGTWISDTRDIHLKPAPIFRKEITIAKTVQSARAYLACGGLGELFINGTKVGDHWLDPMYTRFDRRNLYVTHDITALLKNGANALGVVLGNGWYNHQSIGPWNFDQAPWRSRPRFCLDLRVQYTDGTNERFFSGIDWKCSVGEIIFNSIYTGEHIDARNAQEGWTLPGFDDSKWKNAIPVTAPSLNIVAQAVQPIRAVEELPVRKMTKFSDRHYLFDLGRNVAGVSRLKVAGERGTVIRLKHGERLKSDGTVDLSNIDAHYRPLDDTDPFGTDIYILAGKGEEYFRPSFNYKGFQYVEVIADRPIELTQGSLTGYFMHSDVPAVGTIQSSDTVVNKLWKAANSSYLSNLYGYPTDCPHREKNGWTGDAHTSIETGLYNFDGITVYEKWLADHRDEQQPNGVLPAIIPTGGWGYTWANGPDWTSTIAIIPWNIYLFYGDSRLLKENYSALVRYVDHITQISPSGLTDWGLGDWIPVKSRAPKELTSSLFYFADVTILAKSAKLFGNGADYEKYTRLALQIKEAINDKYLNRQTGLYGSGCQTELSAPLFWGVVPEDMVRLVAKNLANRVIADGKHLDVGLLGTKTILNALSANGYADLAFEVAAQRTFPSWGWWIVNGATTLYENWPIDAKSDISMNHIMFGEVDAWLYKSPGGIYPDEANPGFKNIRLKPDFVKGLSHFEARHNGPFGEIVSSWRRNGGRIDYHIVIPPNSSADLHLNESIISESGKAWNHQVMKIPTGEQTLHLESGTYDFILK